MQIEKAKYTDMPALLALAKDMHKRSKYSALTLVERRFKALVIDAIRVHPKQGCLFVARETVGVSGFILGTVDTVYGITAETYATDLFFYVKAGASPHAASKLLAAFMSWAHDHSGAVEIRLGITDAIAAPERAAKLYARAGLKPAGLMMATPIRKDTSNERCD